MDNHALVDSGAVIDAEGFKAEALMKDVGGTRRTSLGRRDLWGERGRDGVAGSFALNYDETDTEAGIATGASVDADAGDVVISAANTSEAEVQAKANAGAGGTGVGVSVGINIAGNNATRAQIGDDALLTGGKDVTLSATGSHKVDTLTEGGGKAADGTGVGGSLALTVAVNNDTEAAPGPRARGWTSRASSRPRRRTMAKARTTAKGEAERHGCGGGGGDCAARSWMTRRGRRLVVT